MAAHNWDKYFDTSSEYWDKLQKLYEINDNYPKKKVRGRELHHKFLRCFSRVEGAPIDNDKENLVSLSCGDHFLAHYYIWKCTNKGYRRYTCRPVILMYKKSLKYVTDETAERIAADWSYILTNETLAAYNRSRKGTKQTKEHIEAVRQANSKYWVKVINLETSEIYDNRISCPYKTYLGLKPLKLDEIGWPKLGRSNNKCVRKNIYDIVAKCFDISKMTTDEIFGACLFTWLCLQDIKLTKSFRLIELVKHLYINDLDIDDVCKVYKPKRKITDKVIKANEENAKKRVGGHWYNNGKQVKYFNKGESAPPGWTLGMLHTKREMSANNKAKEFEAFLKENPGHSKYWYKYNAPRSLAGYLKQQHLITLKDNKELLKLAYRNLNNDELSYDDFRKYFSNNRINIIETLEHNGVLNGFIDEDN